MQIELETLLDQTRDAVLVGDLATLADLAPQVSALAEELPRLDAAAAGRLIRLAERNAQLLQAATRGLRAAQSRLTEIVEGPTLTTYDARGQRAAIAQPSALQPRRF
ncbi:MAG: hypothetical protein HC783_11195 [Rhodobacteraceae bacterium]|nr:hypothetical protein [Paracoccaceae bacterium]